MKTIKLFIMMVCVMVSTTGFSNVRNFKKAPLPLKATIRILGEIGKNDEQCKKISLQCLDIEFGLEIVSERTSALPGTIIATVAMEKSGELLFTFFLPNEPFEDFMSVIKNTSLSKNLCKEFGFNSMIIPQGEYQNKRNADGSITSRLKVITK